MADSPLQRLRSRIGEFHAGRMGLNTLDSAATESQNLNADSLRTPDYIRDARSLLEPKP